MRPIKSFRRCLLPVIGLMVIVSTSFADRVDRFPSLLDRIGLSGTALPDGRVLIAGGLQTVGPKNVSSGAAALWDPASRRWREVARMSRQRAGHTATLLSNGQVLVIGGELMTEERAEFLQDAEKWNPTSGKWLPAGHMAFGRAYHDAVLLPSGDVLVIGGDRSEAQGDVPLADCEIWASATGTFRPTGSVPAALRGYSVTVDAEGGVLLTGGEGNSGAVPTAMRWEPTTGQWSQRPALHFARMGHRSVLLAGGKILVVGGAAKDTPSEVWLPDAKAWVLAGLPGIAGEPAALWARKDYETAWLVSQSGARGGTRYAASAFDTVARRWRPRGSLWSPAIWQTIVPAGDANAWIVGGNARRGRVNGRPVTIQWRF